MFSALLVAILAVPASAAAPAELSLSDAFASARARVPQVRLRAVDACFERSADARADAAGLPQRFCLKNVGTSVPPDAGIFDGEATGLVDEGQGVRPGHISGGSFDGRTRGIIVELFTVDAPAPVCGKLNHAFAAVYFDVDAQGAPVDGPVEVRGFLIDGSSLCRTEAESVEFLYRRVP